MTAEPNDGTGSVRGKLAAFGLAGFVAGLLVAALAVKMLMPGMMIVTHQSRYDVEGTVSTLREAIKAEGWAVAGVKNMRRSMAGHGVEFPREVRVVQLCNADYAAEVLADSRRVSCLMPCSISVWEADDGTVRISRMNTRLMGKMFGGTVARVMGGSVARDEEAVLEAVVAD
ncbi:MAG: DUF302 domain-containing protein [Planctomycetota bacterium]